MRARRHPEALVLASLQMFEVRWTEVRRVDWSCIVDEGRADSLVSESQILEGVAPIRTCQSLQITEARGDLAGNYLGMRAKGKLRIQGHTKD